MENSGITIDLIKELESMSDYILLRKIKRLSRTIDIFQGNYNELIYHLDNHNDPLFAMDNLLGVDKKHLLDSYRSQIVRLLHNFIASSLTLTDHTRVHYNEIYKDKGTFDDYHQKIKEFFAENPLALFVKCLRQFFQHYQLPDFTTQMIWNRENGMTIKLMLEKEKLLSFSNWNKKALDYINSHDKQLDLKEVITEYQILIENFYTWFLARQFEINKDCLQKVNEKIEELKKSELKTILSLIKNRPNTNSEFESLLYTLFSSEDLKFLRSDITAYKKSESVIALLDSINKLSDEEKIEVRKIYKNNK